MSNYCVTGSLNTALNALDMAANTIRCARDDSPDGKLRDRVLRAIRTVESIDKQAKKLIPGGFKSVPNAREEDKRAQRAELDGR